MFTELEKKYPVLCDLVRPCALPTTVIYKYNIFNYIYMYICIILNGTRSFLNELCE